MPDMSLLRLCNSQCVEERHSAESRLRELQTESYSGALPEGLNATYSSTSEKPSPEYRRPPQSFNTYFCILFGSICGVLARKSLQLLTTYTGSFLEGVVWANFVACVVMGMVVESEKIWCQLATDNNATSLYISKAAIPLYAGITTGFCGSCSSFSSFILETFTKGANLPPSANYPTSGYGVLSVIEVVLAQLGMSVCGFRFGAHATRALERKSGSFSPNTYRLLEIMCACLGIASHVVIIVLIVTKNNGNWRLWTFACFFAPWGAFFRFWLAKYLNPRVANFPLGTYAANVIGTVFLAIFTLLAKGKSARDSAVPLVSGMLSCHVLTGLEDGFCGCLTTVSTFVVEICALELFHGYRYGLVSVVTCFIAVLLIVGSYNWTIGFTLPVC